MKKLLTAIVTTGLAGGALALVDVQQVAHADTAGTGSLRGVIKEKESGAAVPGATVIATSSSLQGEQSALADESGGYYLTALPPGVYTLTVYYNDTTFSRSNVLVQVGKEAVINIAVDTAATKGEVITISGSAPIVDQGSTKVGTTITSDFTNNVPTGRTFGAVMQETAGAQGDRYGVSFAGATSAENTFVVEGINTTDTGFGTISTNLPNEFVQETEVVTGGYNAEFGRATGAIVNVVTKTGSNQFHGSVFGHLQNTSLTATSKSILRQGTAIDSQTNQDYRYDVGAELGGPIIKDKLWFHVGFTPTFQKLTTTRIVNRNVDKLNNTTGAAMDGGDGVADVDPATGFTVREKVDSRDIPRTFNTYFFTAKLTGAISSNHQWQISGFGNPAADDDIATGLIHNPDALRAKIDTGAYDVSGKWTSKFAEGKTQIDAVVGFHNGFTKVKPLSSDTDVPAVVYNYTRSLYDFADIEGTGIEGCNDKQVNNPYPNLAAKCPVSRYVDRGLGFLEDRTNNRTSAVLSLTQRVKAAGQHVFKVGIDTELSTYNSGRRYSGGAFLTRDLLDPSITLGKPDDDGQFTITQYLRYDSSGTLDCGLNNSAKCKIIPQLDADTNDRSIAAYVQDQWQIRPNLTLNLGLRWEQQTGYVAKFLQGTTTPDTAEKIPDVAFQLSNLVAPRIGFIYDPTQEGKSKIFGHWGRFYENIPMDMNVRAFGGETTAESVVGVDADGNADPMCKFDHGTIGSNPNTNVLNPAVCKTSAVSTLGGSLTYWAPGTSGQYTQEILVGGEYELIPDMTIGANYIHRTLPNVIEDMSTDGGRNYFIANPAQNYDEEAAKLEAQAKSTTDMNLAGVYTARAQWLRAVKNFDPPSRNYDAIELIAKKRPSGNSLLQASYTYSRALGNYPGLFSTETGQLDPNITSQYDLPDLMPNRYGASGLDRPHNLKVDGFYAFDLKKAGVFVVGGSFRAQSGLPANTLAAHTLYGQGESYLLPRGQNYRSPATSQLDTHLSYGYQLGKTTRLEGFIDIFNLLNSQTETSVDAIYSTQVSLPIVGGDSDDLAHAKRVQSRRGTANVIVKNQNYGKLNGHQAPLTGQLGFRLTF